MNDIIYLLYRKLRPAFGIPFAFVLMSGAFLGGIDFQLLVAAFGFLFIDLFGNFYNDYWDYAEDVRNGRNDKFTTRGLITAKSALSVSIAFASLGVLILMFSNLLLMGVGISYLILLFAYSHRAFRLKGNLVGYAIVSSPFFLLPMVVGSINQIPSWHAFPLASFFFFQCIYILCQKDSTDLKDDNNLFINEKWMKSFTITAFFALSSTAAFFYISLLSPILFLAFALNIFAKANNLKHIFYKSITRQKRSNFVLMEFLSHYLSSGGVIFA